MEINRILKSLLDNEIKSKQTINMVPSENFCSAFSRIPLILDLYNRYFFNADNDSLRWNFRGAQDIYELETEVAIPLLKELGKSEFVNLRPISGLNCMSLVMSALGKGGSNSVLLVSPDQGGHYASKDLAESLGLNVDFIAGFDNHNIDYDSFEVQLTRKEYQLIYIDQSHCLFPIDIATLCNIVKRVSPSTKVHVDASHWLGLILGSAMINPLLVGADSYGGTTHKTFPGPQRAVFFTNQKEINDTVKNTQYFMISSHHFGSVASLAISLLEFKQNGGQAYATSIINNAQLLAQELSKLGYDVKGKTNGFTAGHQIWMSTNNLNIDSYLASERLYENGIRVNVFSELPGYNESIMRIGVNEITRLGAQSEDMIELASLIDSAIMGKDSVDNISKKVEKLRNKNKSRCQFNFEENYELSSLLHKLISCTFENELKLIHS